jgi:putative salt-induced outer membrane protein YdiY
LVWFYGFYATFGKINLTAKMNKNYLLLLLSVFIVNVIQAQDEVPSVEKNQFKINMISPGFVYEHGFTTKNTLYSEISVGVGYSYNSFYNESNVYFSPLISEQFRHYYNLEKRAKKGKRTAHNSANFFALNAQYNFRSISTNERYREYVPSTTIAVLWGLQRTYKRKFNMEFNLGPGINIDQYNTEFVPVANFTLGWVIGK